jgi:hypothetical protein
MKIKDVKALISVFKYIAKRTDIPKATRVKMITFLGKAMLQQWKFHAMTIDCKFRTDFFDQVMTMLKNTTVYQHEIMYECLVNPNNTYKLSIIIVSYAIWSHMSDADKYTLRNYFDASNSVLALL